MKVLIDNNSYKSFKKAIRHYYKYSYDTFTQPILTNGNQPLESNAFAIYAADYYSDYYPWQAFDNDTTTLWIPAAGTQDTHPEYMIMYNPNPIQATKLTITNAGANAAMVSGSIDASNDGTNWTTVLNSWTNSNQSAYQSWDINLPSNISYYNYYRLNISEWKHYTTRYRGVSDIKIIGTEKTIIDGTSSDYDFYKDIDVYESLV